MLSHSAWASRVCVCVSLCVQADTLEPLSDRKKDKHTRMVLCERGQALSKPKFVI